MHSAPPHVLTAGLTLLAILIAAIAMGLFRKPLDVKGKASDVDVATTCDAM
jgi:hypothetical protein